MKNYSTNIIDNQWQLIKKALELDNRKRKYTLQQQHLSINNSMGYAAGNEGDSETCICPFFYYAGNSWWTLNGIEVVHMLKKNQMIKPGITMFKSFCKLAA